MYVAKSENFRYIGMASECRFPMYVIIGFIVNTSEARKSRQSRCIFPSKSIKLSNPSNFNSPTKSTKNKDRYKYTEVPSEYSVYEYRLFLLYFYMKKAVWLDYYYKEKLLYQKYTKEYKLYDI